MSPDCPRIPPSFFCLPHPPLILSLLHQAAIVLSVRGRGPSAGTCLFRDAITLMFLPLSCFPPLLSPQDLAVMMFSVDESKGKVLVYAGVPDEAAKRGLVVLDWLRAALVPVEGKGGGGKGGVAQGQVSRMP